LAVTIPADHGRFVVGYHGCDKNLARRVLVGDEKLQPSRNDYDWLGHGIYFWEQGPDRAMQFAVSEARRNSKKVKMPAVIGAYIFLGNCFDLLDVRFTQILTEIYNDFKRDLKRRGIPMPGNEKRRNDGTKLFHKRDQAVIEYAVGFLGQSGKRFDTVRGCFLEGERVYPGAEIRRQSHIQIAVRESKCILGYFHPTEIN
jgi:hypothetical protein